jgi:phytoene synthase
VAHGHFRDAADAMTKCDPKAMKPARVMGASYAAILDRLEARGWDRLGEPVRVAKWRKIWIAVRYGML